MKKPAGLILIIFVLAGGVLMAQTTAFTYQGKLTDGGAAADGQYDLQFKLFDLISGGTQIGGIVSYDDVQVSSGVFTVNLNFGSSPFTTAAPRYLEIAVRAGFATGAYTTLAPRQLITSSPYSVQTIRAASAAVADNSLQLGGIAANQFVQTNDSRLTDDRTPLAGSANYIQNIPANGQQTGSFNINGGGTANIFNAATQYNIGGNRVLSIAGTNNIFAGSNAGLSNSSGGDNSFFGTNAGQANTFGNKNAFFGANTGKANTTGGVNSIFGYDAGKSNINGSENSFFGFEAGRDNTSGAANSFFGTISGQRNTTGELNSFFGGNSGSSNTTGKFNSFFGVSAGNGNVSGENNAYFGAFSGGGATSTENTFIGTYSGGAGSQNAALGFFAKVGAGNLTNATALGSYSYVTQSNSLILGSINGLNGAIADTNVGIGTTAPQQKLHVDGNEILSTGIGSGFKFRDRGSTSFADDWVWYSSGNIARFFRAGAGDLLTVRTNGNVGIGTGSPNTKLQVAGGSVYISNPNSLIITSPNGACWFITVNNAGILSTISVACP